MSDWTREDIRAALAAVDRWGGVDTQIDSNGDCYVPVNRERAMAHALDAALASRAKRESRAAMDSLELRVAAHQNRVLAEALEVLR